MGSNTSATVEGEERKQGMIDEGKKDVEGKEREAEMGSDCR